MSKEISQLQIPISASELFASLNRDMNRRLIQHELGPRQRARSSSPDQNLILEQQLLINQQKRAIDYLEATLLSHKQIVATLTDDLGMNKHRLASTEREKEFLAEEVSFMSSLVVSELPEQFTRPVQQSTVLLPKQDAIVDEAGCSGGSQCQLNVRQNEGVTPSLSSLDNDDSVLGKDEDYYDDSSCESGLMNAPQRRTKQDLKLKTTRDSSWLSHGLRSSQRHDNLLDLLLPSDTGDVPSVVFVRNERSFLEKGAITKKEASKAHCSLERQTMFSAMTETVDQLLRRKKRPRIHSGAALHSPAVEKFLSCDNPSCTSSKKRGHCKSI